MTQMRLQQINKQSGRVKIVRWLLLFFVGTIVGSLLLFVIPYGDEAPEFLVSATTFWLYDRLPNSISFWSTPLFAGTDMYLEDVVTFVLTAIYFGIIVVLAGSGNKKQTLVGISLVIIYLGGTCYTIYLTILSLS